MRLMFWKNRKGFEPHAKYLGFAHEDKEEEAKEEVKRLEEIFKEKQDAEAKLSTAQRQVRILENAVPPTDLPVLTAAKGNVTTARLALSHAEDNVREAERYYRLHFPEFQGKL